MHFLDLFLNHVLASGPVILGMRFVVVVMLFFACFVSVQELWRWRLPPALQSVGTMLFCGMAILTSWTVCALSPASAAKVGLILVLVVLSLGCVICLFNIERWQQMLRGVEQDCDLATNLTFLQGEMVRAQLEAVNARLRKAVEPQEAEITETVLKTLSPFVMLYFRKEKNLIKWSLAAAKTGRDLLRYFWK